MFTTYGIKDPKTGLFIYVGQTQHYERRVKNHLRLRKKGRPNYGPGFENIKTRMFDMISSGITPEFEVLETCEDETASLLSETQWVEKLASKGHPLLNRWRDHRSLIKEASCPV